jgi:hypothetical protein
MNRNEYSKFWNERVVKHPYALASSGLPKSAQVILEDWGLPRVRGWHLGFKAIQEPLERKRVGKTNYLVIGNDYEVPLGLKEDGTVWCLESELEKRREPRFMNSSLSTFVEFLCVYQNYRRKVRRLDEEDEERILGLIEKSAKQMKCIDPTAMGSEEFYWPVIVEQMTDGSL